MLETASVHTDSDGSARSEEILRLEARAYKEVTAAASTYLKTYSTEILLDYVIVHINLIFDPCYFCSVDLNRFEITKTLQSNLRLLYLQT